MGHAVKRLLKACWNGLRPALKPFVRRFDARLNDHFARLSHQLSAWNSHQCAAIREVELLGDSMIREIARMQSQIAALEAHLVEPANAPSALAAEADAHRLGPREASSRAA